MRVLSKTDRNFAGHSIQLIGVYYSYYETKRDEYTGQIRATHYTDDGFGNLILCDDTKETRYRYSYTH